MPELKLKPWVGTALFSLFQTLASTGKDIVGEREGREKVLSELGGFIGSPFGLLPLISTAYSAGLGQQITIDESKAWRTARLNPAMVVQLWLRKYAKNGEIESWFNDLRDQGFSDERIEAIKELAQVLPSPNDVIRFAVKEAYTPEVAETYGQYQDFPDKAMEDAEKIGLSKDLFRKYWAAHWDLPSVSQGFDMLHRGVITREDLTLLLRTLDIMPYWRDKLINTSYNIITRVDARRMWDMRVIDDAKLLEIYKAEGYTEDDAKALVTWTKVYVTLPDVIARYKNGWINSDTIITELTSLGLSEDKATDLFQQKIKNPNVTDRLAPERNLVKSDIIAGFKRAILNYDEAKQGLQNLGYDESEADYILVLNTPSVLGAKKDLTSTDVTDAVSKGLMPRAEGMTYLMRIGYDDWEANLLLNLKGATKKTTPEKSLSKSDITSAYKKGVINPSQAMLELTRLGYDNEEAEIILAINKPTAPKAT